MVELKPGLVLGFFSVSLLNLVILLMMMLKVLTSTLKGLLIFSLLVQLSLFVYYGMDYFCENKEEDEYDTTVC